MLKLSEGQVIHKLQDVRHVFSYSQGRLVAEFKFQNFADAFGFVCKLSMHIAELKHYPEIAQQDNKVKVGLFTEKVKGLTSADFEMAKVVIGYV